MTRPSVSTATGDDGTTGLYGGARTTKDHPRLHAYGDIDELNALLGLILAEPRLPPVLEQQLGALQSTLFELGADLATPEGAAKNPLRLNAEHVAQLERWGVELEAELPLLTHFILPGGTALAGRLHIARTVSRRAERWLVSLQLQEPVNPHAAVFLNRLSDYLFLAARYANKWAGGAERIWDHA